MSLNPEDHYLKDLPDWKTCVKGKWVIFDADAIINITYFDATSLIDDLEENSVINCSIHPVKVELLRTENRTQRALVASVLSKILVLPLTDSILEKALDIQV